MTVRDIVTQLMKYNMDADFRIFVNNSLVDKFGFSFGSTAGITESRSTDVNLEIEYDEQLNSKPASEQLVEQSTPAQPEVINNSRAAHVGSNVSQGKGNWFAGTSWGS